MTHPILCAKSKNLVHGKAEPASRFACFFDSGVIELPHYRFFHALDRSAELWLDYLVSNRPEPIQTD